MIVGNGLIANLFKNDDRENVVFFASGVSNSLETEKSAFLREENLLRKHLTENPEKIFIYFSTCSIYDSSKNASLYVNHKLKMERLVEDLAPKYLILRVSNAVGKGGNPNLLMNYLVNSVKEEKIINVHTLATRNLIDADDIKNITLELIDQGRLNQIINVAYLENSHWFTSKLSSVHSIISKSGWIFFQLSIQCFTRGDFSPLPNQK